MIGKTNGLRYVESALIMAFVAVSATANEQTSGVASVRAFSSPADAQKYYKLFETTNSTSKIYPPTRGNGRSCSISTVSWNWYRGGNYVGSTYDWVQVSQNSCGTVIAYPDGPFKVEEAFEYRDLSRPSTERKKGLFVTIPYGISHTGAITWSTRLRCVKNIVESGFFCTNESGKKERVRGLGRVVRERYHPLSVKTYYSDGAIGFLLFEIDGKSQVWKSAVALCEVRKSPDGMVIVASNEAKQNDGSENSRVAPEQENKPASKPHEVEQETSGQSKNEVAVVDSKQAKTLKDAVERLISRLKEAKYSFDEQAIGKYELETQKMVLEEMWYDHLHEQEKSGKH